MEPTILVADDDDAVANLVERRWFAASTAVKALQDECEILREVMAMAEESWRGARARLAEFEMLRDALAERLADREGLFGRAAQPIRRGALSAA